ncbi:ferric reductase-like transmembrane domain-containing protein [Roseateles sp.]|uniref:ferric reductase-like transmembrane domain-containing protein n=1 Tax=Roseateles sp. TaxID=1971397 RepID=UPI00286B8E24|nr:ferric reductase-like transmembrane domain-containing protein [Roseateles sp.]
MIHHFHRPVSLAAVGLVFAHPLIIFAAQPELLARPESGEIPIGAVAALLSIGALATVVVAALWRVKLKLSYELWQRTHIALALTAIIGGIVHMVGGSFHLQDPVKCALWIALVAFWVALLIYVRLVKPLSKPPPGWAGETGHITAELLSRHLPSAYDQHEYFICGPNPMMDAVETALGRFGVPMSKYYSERYSFA